MDCGNIIYMLQPFDCKQVLQGRASAHLPIMSLYAFVILNAISSINEFCLRAFSYGWLHNTILRPNAIQMPIFFGTHSHDQQKQSLGVICCCWDGLRLPQWYINPKFQSSFYSTEFFTHSFGSSCWVIVLFQNPKCLSLLLAFPRF